MNFGDDLDFRLYRRDIRRFLNLRLIDVERATGVAASRISESERGICRLNPTEDRIVTNFLRDKLAAARADARERAR
jgi:hypothetical protein